MAIRGRFKSQLPATLQANGGLSVSKENGVWTFEPDWTQLALETTLPDAENRQLWVFDPVTDTYTRLTMQAVIDEVPPGPTGATGATGAAGTNGAGYTATSVSSQTIGSSGTKTFTVASGLAYTAGARVRAADTAAPSTNWMEGVVTSYSGTTLVFTADKSLGSGTLTSWNINLGGEPGANGAGTGDVVGPASAVDSNLAAFNTATGKLLKDSLVPMASLYFPVTPQGRLTLTSGTAYPTADVAAATTVYYTPLGGGYVPLWNATLSRFVNTATGGELSQATTDSTKSPAAVANNSNYDLFVWSDAGTLRCTRGPAWTSDTSRNTGAGTTELELLNGIYVNKVAITNGPGARLGTYVGTVRSNGTATIDMKFGTSAAGGGMASLCVWNLYNQALTRAKVQDSTASWTTNTGTVRNVNASATNRVQFVTGLAMHSIAASYKDLITTAAVLSAQAKFGFALDATAEDCMAFFSTPVAAAWTAAATASGSYLPQFGFHYIQAVEYSDGTNTATFYAGASWQGLEVTTLQ